MSIIKKIVSQTAIYGLSSILGRLLNFLLVPLYTYLFNESEYGIVSELYAYVAFIMVIATYGMETAFFKFSEGKYKKEEVHSTSLLSLLLSSSLLLFFLFHCADYIASILQYPNYTNYIQWFALIIFFDTLTTIPFARLREKQKSIQFATIKLINIILNVSLNIIFILVLNKVDIQYIFLSNLISSGLTFFLLVNNYKNLFSYLNFNLWKKMFRFSFPLVFAGLAGMVNETIDTIMLKWLTPEDNNPVATVGVYRACYKISIFLILFIQAFKLGAEPFFFKQANKKNAKIVYAFVMKYFVITSLFILLCITLYLNIFQYFIGEKFRVGLRVVPILLFANLMLGIYYNLSIWYKISNKTNFGALISIFGALITIILNYYLIQKFSYIGSAWATLICYSSMVVLSYMCSRKYYPINYPLKSISIYFFITLFIFFLNQYLTQGNLIYNTILICIFISIFWIRERKEILASINAN